MDRVTKALRYWLKRNALPVEGVRVIVEFSDKSAACVAVSCVKQEAQPFVHVAGRKVKTTMNGMGLGFAYRSGGERVEVGP